MELILVSCPLAGWRVRRRGAVLVLQKECSEVLDDRAFFHTAKVGAALPLKRTWEVIADIGPASYDIHAVKKYRVRFFGAGDGGVLFVDFTHS